VHSGPGGSHSSPHAAFTLPSPQAAPTSTVHDGEQPSHETALPSSHASAPQRTPSPHPVSSVHAAEQPSQSVELPSSHCSPSCATPSPQRPLRDTRNR